MYKAIAIVSAFLASGVTVPVDAWLTQHELLDLQPRGP